MPPPPPLTADLRGRVCLVTGATSGIGKETARQLARLGAHVVIAARDLRRGEATCREIAGETGNKAVELAVVDVSSQDSTREFARGVLDLYPEIHVLVNNAGTWSASRQLSADGVELTWATNMLGYHLVTDLLLPSLRRAAPSRIVVVASKLAHDLDLSDVQFERRRYDGLTAYAQSKQANRMWTWGVARRLEGSGVTINVLHPGGVDTGLFGKGGGWQGMVGAAYGKVFGRTVAEGADTVVWLAASPEVEGKTSGFYVDRTLRRCQFRDLEEEERLIAVCARMVGTTPA